MKSYIQKSFFSHSSKDNFCLIKILLGWIILNPWIQSLYCTIFLVDLNLFSFDNFPIFFFIFPIFCDFRLIHLFLFLLSFDWEPFFRDEFCRLFFVWLFASFLFAHLKLTFSAASKGRAFSCQKEIREYKFESFASGLKTEKVMTVSCFKVDFEMEN